jgi:imidazolonepropionase-like amidohydrolase
MNIPVLLLALLLPGGLLAGSEEPAPTLLRCGFVVDVEHERIDRDVDLVIEGGRITHMGKALVSPRAASVIDLRQHYCLPGLMDMHTHLLVDSRARTDAENLLLRSSAADALFGLKRAQRMLHNGFTTIRVPGDADYHFSTVDLRDAINRGDFDGPRMLVAPHMLSPLGGHSDANEFREDGPEILGTVVHAGVDNVREAVRREVKYGADWIKIAATGGVMSQRDNPDSQAWTDDEMFAFADEAHRLGVKIAAHILSARAAFTAARAGFDSIEHGTLLDDKTVRLMKDNHVILVPTLYVLQWILHQGASGGITADNYRKAQRVEVAHKTSFLKAYRAGVTIAMGSDSIFPLDEVSCEFVSMVNAGMRPWDSIKSGTVNSAHLLGLQDDTGSLTVGKRADIVAVPGNPVTDITWLQQVHFVMANGTIIRADSPNDSQLAQRRSSASACGTGAITGAEPMR